MKTFFFSFFLLSLNSFASYRLSATFNNCPFLHEDSFALEFGRLHDTLEQQLVAKIEGNARCNAPFASLSQNMTAIDSLFKSNVNPSIVEDIQNEYLHRYLLDLKAEAVLVPPDSQMHLNLENQILFIQLQINQNAARGQSNRSLYKQNRTNEVFKDLFNNMNTMVTGLSNLPPECIDRLGGWQQILPSILNSLSTLSALGGTGYSIAIGASLKLVANLSVILTDLNAKKALKNIIRHKNNKILACLYFNIENAACGYKKALHISQNHKLIEDFIDKKHADESTRTFAEFLSLQERSRDFENVFFAIATMGSPVSLDVGLISKYFQAKKIAPETILDSSDIGQPPAYEEFSSDAEVRRETWLLKIANRGVSVSDYNASGKAPLRDQVKAVMEEIALKLADIKSVEGILTGTRSFVDLKHELDTNVQLLGRVVTLRHYFERILRGEIIAIPQKGMLASAIVILIELENFLKVKFDDFHPHPSNPDLASQLDGELEAYSKEINLRGDALFKVMSSGTIAQVSRQSILSIGSTVQKRIDRVFRMLEEVFSAESLHTPPKKTNFVEYQQDRAIIDQVLKSYLSFIGSQRTFRIEDTNVALKAIEDGFHKEIRHMIKGSMIAENDFYPTLRGETAAHLCALFSFSLNKKDLLNYKARRLYQECKRRYSSLDLSDFQSESRVAIDWEDPCFYSRYRRMASIQQIIFEKHSRRDFIFTMANDGP